MPIQTEQISPFPAFWETRDYTNRGVLVAVVGFRCLNNTPVRLRVTVVGLNGELDWWTPLGRRDNTIGQGEDVTASGFRLPAGAGDRWSIGYGEA